MFSSLYTLGLDFSTQSVTAVVLDCTEKKVVFERKVKFALWVDKYKLDPQFLTVRGLPSGRCEQPPLMFLRALDEVLQKVREEFDLSKIASVSVSAQQHGHMYLNKDFIASCEKLNHAESFESLDTLFEKSFSYASAPIWMTSDTTKQIQEIRESVGGSERLIALSGSDCPERFTGAVIRRIAQEEPEVYKATEIIHLISSFFTGVLSGVPKAAIDYGNACGMSLMNYQTKEWDDTLLAAVAGGIRSVESGKEGLKKRLPRLAVAYEKMGGIAKYFVERYGFSTDCVVTLGSGDNPQTKTSINGDLLSLGTSIVYMREGTFGEQDKEKSRMFNAMYDGLGRAFSFACRTNGALLWDQARNELEISLTEQEELLTRSQFNKLLLWQELVESFPPSKKISLENDFKKKSNAEDREDGEGEENGKSSYPALIDTTLLLLKIYAADVSTESKSRLLYVTGGPSESAAICQRLADLWQRKVVSIGSVGAGLGAAVCAYAGIEGDVAAVELSDRFMALTQSRKCLPRVAVKEEVEKLERKVKNQFEPYLLN